MRHAPFAMLLGLSLVASATAHAQSTEATAAPSPPAACELHIWPSAKFAVNIGGLLAGSVVDRMLNPGKDKEGRTKLVSALDPDTQVAIFRSMDLPKMLGLPPATLIVHPEERDDKDTSHMARHTQSQSKCYGELLVRSITFEKTPLTGRKLFVVLEYDDFYGQMLLRWYANRMMESKVTLFPPAEGEDIDAAVRELTDIFKSDVEQFAAHAARKRVAGRHP